MLNLCQVLHLFLITLFSVSITFTQEKAPELCKINGNVGGGVLNGKARSLVKPIYPPAAKAVQVSGAVNIQVLIDENGDVVSASAVKGHPLLRAAAVQAARASKFTPTQLCGQPVKVSGIIVYNFVGQGLNLTQIGFALSSASFLPKLGEGFPALQIFDSFPPDWIEERRQADGLIYKQNQEEYENRKDVPSEPRQKPLSKDTVTVVSSIGKSENSEFKEISKTTIANNLIELLKGRYATGEIQSWSFKLGLALGKIQAQIDDDAKLRMNLRYLNQVVTVEPDTVNMDLIYEIKALAAIAEKKQIDSVDRTKIETFLKLLRLR